MAVHTFKQRSEEWFRHRCGRVTASRVADLMAQTKSEPAAIRKNYMADLVVERLTGEVHASYVSESMRWGMETEPQARAAYELWTETDVVEVGFIDHPAIGMAGCSPDGLVGDKGMIEIKCPNTATHLDTLLTGRIDEKYIKQIQFQMACAERDWCDFVSFDPRLPIEIQMWSHRIPRNNETISKIESAVSDFLTEMDAKITQLSEKYNLETT